MPPPKKKAAPRDNKGKRMVDRILEETGTTNVANLDFCPKEKCWIITYKSDLKPDRFVFFNQAYDFLDRG